MDSFTLESPLDMHIHFRTGAMLEDVVPETSAVFSGALVMPNLIPPITTLDQINNYRREIIDAVPEGDAFEPFMTLYFQTDYDRMFLGNIRGHILSIKLYPKGITTNSSHGVDPHDQRVEKILGYMEELGIPLCVHGETKGYVMRREREFLQIYDRWARMFPNLKIIMEHISTIELVNFLSWHENVFATITPHHLTMTTDHLMGDMLRPHLFCKPVLKEPEDRDALQNVVLGGKDYGGVRHKVMLGTDSAPHTEGKKLQDCGCAGVFNAPLALQVLAPLFAEAGSEELFQSFASNNARRIYGLAPIRKTVVLKKGHFVVPSHYGEVVPMLAGETLEWIYPEVTNC